jgi:hypothetical protein
MTDGLPSTSKTKCTVLQLQLKQWRVVSQTSIQCFDLLEFLAVASNVTIQHLESIISTVREAPVQHIDIQPRSNKADSYQIVFALFSKVENCNNNVYNCNFTK